MEPEDLDPIYFADASWAERLLRWLKSNAPQEERFVAANEETITTSILTGNTALRMVVNIPAVSLLSFLESGKYKNTYEVKAEIGETARVNERRERVDQALFGAEAAKHYFGALALNGTGVRFYGEYCMVLNSAALTADTQIMDRNSWHIEFPPLSAIDKSAVIGRLKGHWEADAVPMAKMKVMPLLREKVRLATTGIVSDSVLQDESFIEVHKKGSFEPRDLHEVREAPEDAAIEAEIIHRRDDGHAPNPEEWLWIARRGEVTAALVSRGVKTRVVATSGRTRG